MSYRCDVCGAEHSSADVATVSRHRQGAVAVWWCVSCLAEGKRLIRDAREKAARAAPAPMSCGTCTMFGRVEGTAAGRCFHGKAPTQLAANGVRIAPEVGIGPAPEWCPKPPPKTPLPVLDPPAKNGA